MTEPESAPLEKLLRQISGQWTMYILWILDTNGTLRFGELKRKVNGISPKVLTQRLRMLEDMNIIHRHYEPTIPPQVSYGLTERGQELSNPLYDLCDMASRWYAEDDPA